METISRSLLTFLLNSLWQIPLAAGVAALVCRPVRRGPRRHSIGGVHHSQGGDRETSKSRQYGSQRPSILTQSLAASARAIASSAVEPKAVKWPILRKGRTACLP